MRVRQKPGPWLAGSRVAVTGAGGFIGSHLIRALAESGARQIVAIDRRPLVAAPALSGRSGMVLAGDRTVLEPTDDLLDGVDVVIHLAAHVSPPKSVEDPISDATENILGTIGLLESCRRAGVRRIVYASSAAVYGRPTGIPVAESHRTHPESPYGQSKLAAEQYCQLYGRLHGLSVVALRCSSVYGPGQPLGGGYAGVIRLFLDRLNRGLPLQIEGDGSQSRDFIHVSDVIRANLLAATSTYEGILNIGSGVAVTISEVATLVAGAEYPIEYLPARRGDIQHMVANVAAAREALGFDAGVPLERGLDELKVGVGEFPG